MLNPRLVPIGALERALIIRSCMMWLLTRLLICVAFLLLAAIAPSGATDVHPLFLTPPAALIAIAVTATLTWLVTRMRFEDLLLANLAIPPWIAASLVSVPPLALEVVMAQVGAP